MNLDSVRELVPAGLKPAKYRYGMTCVVRLYLLWQSRRKGTEFPDSQVDRLYQSCLRRLGPRVLQKVDEAARLPVIDLEEVTFLVDGNPHQNLQKPRQWGRALRLIAGLLLLIRVQEINPQAEVSFGLFSKHLAEHLGPMQAMIELHAEPRMAGVG